LNPEDVAWVTEWQLACAFPWLPLGEESRIEAEPAPDAACCFWGIRIRVGRDLVRARLPLRDLARMVRWCHQVHDLDSLLHPPAWVRASLLAVRRRLHAALDPTDPLCSMGYAGRSVSDLGPGGATHG
jgi:hypothetical protein